MKDLKIIYKTSTRRSSSISIRINSREEIIASAPIWVGKKQIDHFIETKRDWIESKIALRQPPLFTSGLSLHFLGQLLILEIIHNPMSLPDIIITDGKMTLTHYHPDSETHKTYFRRWIIQNGIAHLTERVNYFSQTIGVEYSSIRLKEVSSIWGSCSPDNHLSFNWKLLLTPSEILDYVVAHEVSHMIHRNHSSHFWAQVARLSPNFGYHRSWLRRHHSELDAF